jgi:hypothetical protein
MYDIIGRIRECMSVITMFEESGAGRGARDSGTDEKGSVEAAAVAFEGSSSVCMAGRRLFRLNMPST